MKILFPIEEPATAEALVEYAKEQRWAEDSKIRLLSVIQPLELIAPLAPMPMFCEAAYEQMNMNKNAEAILNKTMDGLRKAGYKNVEAETALGVAGQVILEEIKEWKPDFVVMGKHNRHGFEKFVMGSVSEQVAAKAPCTVMIVRLPEVAAGK